LFSAFFYIGRAFHFSFFSRSLILALRIIIRMTCDPQPVQQFPKSKDPSFAEKIKKFREADHIITKSELSGNAEA
jgi:hypothetical protein